MNKWVACVAIGFVIILGIGVVGVNPFATVIDSREMLSPEYREFETGTRRLPNGSYLVAALTRMPEVKARMVRWWFSDFLRTTEHYKWWHPDDHVWMDWENKQPGTIVGASHLVHEFIGGQLNKLRIQFVDPAEFFGNDPNDEHTFVICAHVGLLDQPMNIAKMCHVVRDTPGGAEMRSHFWLGYPAARDGNGTRLSAAGVIGNTALVRYYAVKPAQANGLLKHCIEEMSYLSDLLPSLYVSELTVTNPGRSRLTESPATP